MNITENVRDIAEELEREDLLPDVTYIENEGDDVVRIDYDGEKSLWLYQNGGVDGLWTPEAKTFLLTKGFNL